MTLLYGRRAPKNHPAIQLSYLLTIDATTGSIPAHPNVQDNLSALHGGWKMLGNDVAGDCVAVTWANVRRLLTALIGNESYATIDWVWELYKTQNPDFDPNGDPSVDGPGSPADGGMDIQTVLEYLVKFGGPDGVKAVAFAKVDHTSFAEVKAAISIFGYVWTGINVTRVNEQEFSSGDPWNYVASSPNEGGHSVLTGGYLGRTGDDEQFITWAQETGFTDSFWTHQVEECWVVIWPEHLETAAFQAGINVTALAAAYTSITGKQLVITPTPAPPPAPAPTPPSPTPEPVSVDDADRQLIPVAINYVEHRHTTAINVAMAEALEQWLTSKGS